MPKSLKVEIQQSRPFQSLEQEAFLNISRTSDLMLRGIEEVLKPSNLSPTQYNVLRILRGAWPQGLACRHIGERMITRDPDITRLLDRLENRGLVTRNRESADRRVITARITDDGRNLLTLLDPIVEEEHRRQLGHIPQTELKTLISLLERVRDVS